MSEPILLHATNAKAKDKTLVVYGRAIAQELVDSGEWRFEPAVESAPEPQPEAAEKPAAKKPAAKAKG
jgi:hypothetical protein